MFVIVIVLLLFLFSMVAIFLCERIEYDVFVSRSVDLTIDIVYACDYVVFVVCLCCSLR